MKNEKTEQIECEAKSKLMLWLCGFWAVISLEKLRMIKRNKGRGKEILKRFNSGVWVFGLDEHKGCSPVFIGAYGDAQPFSYLNDYNPNNFRLATKAEIKQAQNSI